MRLIDADAFRTSIEKDRDASDMPKMWHEGIAYAINHIIHAPTADAGEVVRCKDCKHWVTVVDHKKAEYGLCDAMKAPIGATPRDGFCYKGERKETEDDND